MAGSGPGGKDVPAVPCPHCDFMARSEFGLQAHVRMKHGDESDKTFHVEPPGETTQTGQTDPPPAQTDPGEAPAPRKKSIRERLIGPKKPKVEGPKPGNEKAPQSKRWGSSPAKRGRVDVGPLAGMAYALVGGRLAAGGGKNAPVGNVLLIQQPIAEAKFDALIKGTVADRLVQPFAKAVDSSEDAAALIGLPICTMAWVNAPNLRPALLPVMRMMVQATLVDLVPAMKKAKAQAERQADSLRELGELFPDIPPGTDPVDAVLGGILNATEEGEVSDNGRVPDEAAEPAA